MADIKHWFIPELTKKEVYEGLYPVVITQAKLWNKEVEDDDGKKRNREILTLTFKTLQQVPFPDKTQGNILVEQNYYFDVQMHVNALNGIARACGMQALTSTDDFEGKTCMIGIINREYQDREGNDRKIAQFGWGLFSYAKILEGAKIEYIANEVQGKPSDEDYKEWFKKHLATYKAPV